MTTAVEPATQRLVRVVARGLLGRGFDAPIDPQQVRRLLVIHTDPRPSNVLYLTPLLRALRDGLPHVRIDLLQTAEGSALVDGLFLVDRIIPFEGRSVWRNPFAIARFLLSLRASDYDAVIDAAPAERFLLSSAVIARATGAPVRIGHGRGDAAHYYTHLLRIDEGERAEVCRQLRLALPLGLGARGLELETSAGAGAERDADALLTRLGLSSGGFVTLVPSTRREERTVDPERLGAILKRLSEARKLPLLVVPPFGDELAATQLAAAAGARAIVLPTLDVASLAALLRRSSLAVMADSSPLPLAVACETPTIGLFTTGDATRFSPPSPRFVALERAARREDLEAALLDAAGRLLPPSAN